MLSSTELSYRRTIEKLKARIEELESQIAAERIKREAAERRLREMGKIIASGG
jgi:predicted RNase H-like nuclease (RuvC/YqgF family)